MRRTTLLAGVIFALGVLVPGIGLADRGGSNLPTKGSHSGSCTSNVVTGAAECVTTGPASHFGLSTMEQDIQLIPTGPGTFRWLALWTLTAASGDQMSGTGAGTSEFAADGIHSTSLGTFTSSGGTGRFEDATSTFDSIAHCTITSLVPPTANSFCEATVVGTLSWGS